MDLGVVWTPLLNTTQQPYDKAPIDLQVHCSVQLPSFDVTITLLPPGPLICYCVMSGSTDSACLMPQPG